jgi:predicted N-acetyltransferase YhbS
VPGASATPPAGRPLLEDDWAQVRALIVDVQPRSAPGFTWEVRRWDGWRWHHADVTWDPAGRHLGRAWESADGTLVAAAHGEGAGTLALQVDPRHRDCEPAMVVWGEEALAAGDGAGGRRVTTMLRDYDEVRRVILERRGWVPTGGWGVTRWQWLGPARIRAARVSPGYRARPLRPGDAADAAALAALLNAAFGRTFHAAAEILAFEAHAPGFDPDLHLVAEAPDGSFAAHVGVTFEPATGLAIVEPVCTHPDHRRRGLAEALIREGLERARRRGATQACVDTGSGDAANRLYAAVGFGEVFVEREWAWREPSARR